MQKPRSLLWICLVLAAGSLPGVLPAQTPAKPAAPEEDYVKAHYTKYEYQIPMRDGKKLATAVYVPKDRSQPVPFLMNRTPYSVKPYGEDQYPKKLGPSDEFEKSGYIFVYQDVRGRYLSEGGWFEMTPHRDQKGPTDVDESTDTHDTIEFLLQHVPGNNGKVGLWGISYPGFYTSASIIDSHPAIKAASPQAPITDLFMGDDAYHGGAFMLSANFDFYTDFTPSPGPHLPAKSHDSFDYGTPDSYQFYLQAGATANLAEKYLHGTNPLFADQIFHPNYDAYWQARNLAPHLKNIHCAVLTVGGWFDAEDLAGALRTYHVIEAQNPGIVNRLVMGPWVHGGWARNAGDHLGDVSFNAKTSEFFRAHIQFPFFEHYLKDKPDDAEPEAWVFETGTNVWRQYPAWPAPAARPRLLYFQPGGRLGFDAPPANGGCDEYVSDPARPVPFTEYTTDTVPQRYMVDDQRFAARRPDVLVYQTEPLTEDVTIAGPVSPKLFVATSGTDSDYVVKLIDVYPSDYPDKEEDTEGKRVTSAPPVLMGGYQQLLRGDPMRAKFRHSWEKPEAMTPGKVEAVNFTMPDLNHTFRKGHRIMVQVQSSWFPLVDLNPQTFTDIPHAKPEDFRKVTEQVWHQAAAASGVEVLVLPQP